MPEIVVALLAEGVDRNILLHRCFRPPFVALLAEGVDRNFGEITGKDAQGKSPSSRRAWIEIHSPARLYSPPSVALLAEGVDRNPLARTAVLAALGRPPRGGRG